MTYWKPRLLLLKIRQINRSRLARRRQRIASNASSMPGAKFDLFSLVDPACIRLRVEPNGPPEVSILIAAYGQVSYSLRCLASIAANNPIASYEVILVEDASGDPDAGSLHHVEGLHYIFNAENLGYLRSCNLAAKRARGKYLLLLNNDTELLPGAIDELVKLAKDRPSAGLIGSRLLYPDGRLQEAGGVVWSDGTASNFGRFDVPNRHSYEYVRAADYCSAASLLIDLQLWRD